MSTDVTDRSMASRIACIPQYFSWYIIESLSYYVVSYVN